MTVKIYGNNGIGPIGGGNKPQKTDSSKEAAKTQASDRVDFSSVLQQVSRTKESSAPSEAQRAEKVAALKEQISNGSYRPDLEKVAESLLKFIAEEK